jgi:glycosyltransferase involved in cell wall biosynthesis
LCGIATFTRDLSQAVTRADQRLRAKILAITSRPETHRGDECFEIRRDVEEDYVSAADFVNHSGTGIVSIQHEYGIFGGTDGSNILRFLSRLRIPSIVTLHTVLKRPSDSQRSIVKAFAHQCDRIVVMSALGARLLAESYGVRADNVTTIPHGIPDLPLSETAQHKNRIGAAGRRVLLTFGLLSPNKGIETVIHALPRILQQFPDVLYFVVGATHPEIKRRDGEEYRQSLEREAELLGVADHVVFRNQFVTMEELCEYLQAADIYVTPYRNEAQITSGALAYAMGAGAAVVSTPYWHAQELLAHGRGRLFPVGDVDALVQPIARLLANEAELQAMREAAYEFTRPMTWTRVGETYVRLIRTVLREAASRTQATATRNSADSRSPRLPQLCLDHILRLTDDTGIIQHATFTIPARQTGYCVDDNARALLAALMICRVTPSPHARRLVDLYLSFLHYCQCSDGQFHNFVGYDRVIESQIGSEDCHGRALWALGATVHMAPDEGARRLARWMFDRAVERAMRFGARGQALSIMGLNEILRVEPEHARVRALMNSLADNLCERFANECDEDWPWFEPVLTYDNAMLPLSLLTAYNTTAVERHLHVAIKSLRFLEDICFAPLSGGRSRLTLIGNRGWHQRRNDQSTAPPAEADEQPIDAAAFVLAFRAAYTATGDPHHWKRMRESFDWFLAANRLGVPLYDDSTGGCRDGLGVNEASQNQGAESTISFLLALLAMLDAQRQYDGEAPSEARQRPVIASSPSGTSPSAMPPRRTRRPSDVGRMEGARGTVNDHAGAGH